MPPVSLLHAFVVFGDAKNIATAADELGITQPALSKQLRQLERAFPEPLFLIRGRKKCLTPFGQDLHRELKRKIGNLHQLVASVRLRHQEPELATVRIAARRGVLDRIGGKLHFSGCVHFREATNEQALAEVLDLSAEIGIVHRFPDSPELVAKPLFREEFCLAVPKKILRSEPTLSGALLQRLGGFPCLGYKVKDELVFSVRAAFGLGAGEVKMARATENYAALAEMVATGLGWAILPSYLMPATKNYWLLPIPEKMIPRRQFFLVYRQEFVKTPWGKKFLEEIRRCFPG